MLLRQAACVLDHLVIRIGELVAPDGGVLKLWTWILEGRLVANIRCADGVIDEQCVLLQSARKLPNLRTTLRGERLVGKCPFDTQAVARRHLLGWAEFYVIGALEKDSSRFYSTRVPARFIREHGWLRRAIGSGGRGLGRTPSQAFGASQSKQHANQ
jgi:hypothetical protein